MNTKIALTIRLAVVIHLASAERADNGMSINWAKLKSIYKEIPALTGPDIQLKNKILGLSPDDFLLTGKARADKFMTLFTKEEREKKIPCILKKWANLAGEDIAMMGSAGERATMKRLLARLKAKSSVKCDS